MSDNPKPTIFSASKLFRSFSSEIVWSPTSILDMKSFSLIKQPFFSKKTDKKTHWSNKKSNTVGLGLVDSLTTCNSDDRFLYSRSKMIAFGSQLKIQIPQVESNFSSSAGSVESPYSPIKFGINNKDSQLALLSHSDSSSESLPFSPGFFTREIELLEEYTCVISHGPNPKKTHIFDNYIMEKCDNDFAMEEEESRVLSENSSDFPSVDFLSSCYACSKPLASKDIFMYRDDMAFCSRECRRQELISDDELRNALI